MTTAVSEDRETLSGVVRRCRDAQRRWQDEPVRSRLRPIKTLRSLLVAECDRLCEAIDRDIGKPAGEALGEVLNVADACRFLQREAASLLRPKRVPRGSRPLWLFGQRDTVHRRPRGVVGIIGTWNYPILLNGVQMAQALAAGNAIIWKPSEVAPATADVLFDLFVRAGFPEGLLHKMPATRAGGAMLVEADIDHLVFTGGVEVGRQIATRLGQRLISSTMELSGNDALFVLPDADLELATAAAWFGFTLNRGQTCVAVRRAFVHRSLYPQFTQALEPLTSAAGPLRLAMASQARQAQQLVDDAVGKGGRVLGTTRDGAPRHEAEFRPTIVVDAHAEMDLFREASFAPLMAVLPYDDLEDALRADAACPYGLGASVFTRQPARVEELARRLRTGFVTVNDVIAPTAHPATPFGGLGHSGWGVTQGAEGLLEMTVPQVVSVRGGTFRPHYDLGAGKTADNEGLVRALLQMGHGRSFWQRWRGFWQVWRAIRKK
ncbi:MAG: aldehyde dehydrogenase family protein [Planctomycetes bacterium]|nr:aldehyde dehydrogenase family protein [Planctomycetota bacterium]